MISIGFLGAFLGGVLSILSPCSALLLPAFFAYAFQSKTQLFARTVVFFLGLAVILGPLGAGIGSVGQLLNVHRDTVITVGGWVIIALGVYTFLGFGFKIPGLADLSGRVQVGSWLSVFVLGMVYGFAGFCAGPLLGAVLTTAAVSGSALYGGLLLEFYALGMTVPLFVLALLWEKLNISKVQGKTRQVGPFKFSTFSMLAGLVFIGMGWMFLSTHGTSALPSLFSTESQFQIQEKVAQATAHIDNAVVMFVIAVIALVVVAAKYKRQQ